MNNITQYQHSVNRHIKILNGTIEIIFKHVSISTISESHTVGELADQTRIISTKFSEL